jgi:5-methyltetrahydrofolate--homocysteine methyltransferase
MAVEFTEERWQRVKDNARRWWAGQLDRPLIQLTIGGRDPGRPAPTLRRVARDTTSYDLSVSPEAIIDRWDYDLSCSRFLGDAFPSVNPDFGPGVIAAFMGARPEPGLDTVWFHTDEDRPVNALDFTYQADNVWFTRVKAICAAAIERWQGLVQCGMTDLGGNLDILSTFRPGQDLLLDLYDHPGDVKRLTWKAHELWWRYFDEINAVLQPVNPGYTAWAPIFSEIPYYILQCDFCYMIGPAMFDEFVKPELEASCRRLGNAFYHLDGPGQLPHLDSLLSIESLKGVQWIPGAGQRDLSYWPDVHRRIRDAGKLIQIHGPLHILDALAEQLGSAEGIVWLGWLRASEEAHARAFLKRYGAESAE